MSSPHPLLAQITQLVDAGLQALTTTQSERDLETWQSQYTSKKSELTALFKSLKSLSPEEKRAHAAAIGQQKQRLQTALQAHRQSLQQAQAASTLDADWFDVTTPSPVHIGSQHPITLIQSQVEDFFISLGYEIADAPEIETEWHNFDALDIPESHPARDMQDTFWIKKDSPSPHHNFVARTQTSNAQIRMMVEHGAPVRMIAPGRVFRNEAVDRTHDSTFYQLEGLVVDKDISLAHLKATLSQLMKELFGDTAETRFRPGYFPFVEPGLEVDMRTTSTDEHGVTHTSDWMEMLGAGMVHPNVLRHCGIDPSVYSGFAFGIGLTRLAMLRYAVPDIRLLFSTDTTFLQKFSGQK